MNRPRNPLPPRVALKLALVATKLFYRQGRRCIPTISARTEFLQALADGSHTGRQAVVMFRLAASRSLRGAMMTEAGGGTERLPARGIACSSRDHTATFARVDVLRRTGSQIRSSSGQNWNPSIPRQTEFRNARGGMNGGMKPTYGLPAPCLGHRLPRLRWQRPDAFADRPEPQVDVLNQHQGIRRVDDTRVVGGPGTDSGHDRRAGTGHRERGRPGRRDPPRSYRSGVTGNPVGTRCELGRTLPDRHASRRPLVPGKVAEFRADPPYRPAFCLAELQMLARAVRVRQTDFARAPCSLQRNQQTGLVDRCLAPSSLRRSPRHAERPGRYRRPQRGERQMQVTGRGQPPGYRRTGEGWTTGWVFRCTSSTGNAGWRSRSSGQRRNAQPSVRCGIDADRPSEHQSQS